MPANTCLEAMNVLKLRNDGVWDEILGNPAQ